MVLKKFPRCHVEKILDNLRPNTFIFYSKRIYILFECIINYRKKIVLDNIIKKFYIYVQIIFQVIIAKIWCKLKYALSYFRVVSHNRHGASCQKSEPIAFSINIIYKFRLALLINFVTLYQKQSRKILYFSNFLLLYFWETYLFMNVLARKVLHAMSFWKAVSATWKRWQEERERVGKGCNGKCIDPKVHNLRHTEIRVFPSTEAARKNGGTSPLREGMTGGGGGGMEYTSPDTLAGPQGGLNGIIPIWKGPHHVVNHTGHHLRPFQRPATAFSMNLSASVKCVDVGGTRMM